MSTLAGAPAHLVRSVLVSQCLIMNEWGRLVVGFRGLRTASVFSQFLLSSCKWSFTQLAVSLSQPGDETGEAMSVRQA